MGVPYRVINLGHGLKLFSKSLDLLGEPLLPHKASLPSFRNLPMQLLIFTLQLLTHSLELALLATVAGHFNLQLVLQISAFVFKLVHSVLVLNQFLVEL
jgi:hypothetical protein